MKNESPLPKRKDEYEPTIQDIDYWANFGKWTLIVGLIYSIISYLLF